MDVVKKNGDTIRTEQLAKELGCKVVEISALKGTGITEAAEAAIASAESKKIAPIHPFTGSVEHCLAHIEEAVVHDMPEEQQRWYAIKLFERDEKVLAQLDLSDEIKIILNTILQKLKLNLMMTQKVLLLTRDIFIFLLLFMIVTRRNIKTR